MWNSSCCRFSLRLIRIEKAGNGWRKRKKFNQFKLEYRIRRIKKNKKNKRINKKNKKKINKSKKKMNNIKRMNREEDNEDEDM